MTEGLNKTLVPPSKKTVKFLLDGLALFFPITIYGPQKGENYPTVDYWVGTGYRRSEFAQLLFNITGKEDEGEAAKIVKEWKIAWDKNEAPSATVPEKLDEMLSQLTESPAETKLSTYEQQRLAKDSLLLSQKAAELTPPKTVPTVETKDSTQGISKVSSILSIPFRTAIYISGPATYSSSAKGEGPGVATARYMLARGISSASIRSLENRVQQLRITPNQLQNLVALIKTEKKTHPLGYKWISIGQKAGLFQTQIASLLVPSADGSMAVLPRKSFIGNAIGRIGQQLFGKLTSKALKAVGKKVAAKIATTAATQAAATAIAPGLANIIVLVGQAIIGKVKDFISNLKSKEGKERILTLLFGSMIIGGIFLGGPLGAALVIGGLVPGMGLLATKAGGFGALGANIGSYGQAFMAGVTGVVFPSIAAPLIISFISIPVAVAIILFIINSGAYIVPPYTAGGEVPEECRGEGPPRPEAAGVLYSSDGKYAYPVAPGNAVGEDCTHWDKTLATDIFPIGGDGTNAPVVAYTSGTIHMTSTTDPKGGKYIILKGDNGMYYYYAHNCANYVNAGARVTVGEVIATTDRTGSAANTPEHLHFAISKFPRFMGGGIVCPSEDFAEKFASYNRCQPEKRCVP